MPYHQRPFFRRLVPPALLLGAALGPATPSPAQAPPAAPPPSAPPLTAAPTSAALPSAPPARVPPLDWPNLARYRAENAQAGRPPADTDRVVFIGDSITDGWGHDTAFFPGKPWLNRGIGGQTTPQMLIRFRPDVVALQPKVVVILAGINDIAGNTGPATLESIEDNLMSMADIATANGIRVVLSSVTPTVDFPWRRGLDPSPKVQALNAWMKDYAKQKQYVYLDYYSALVDEHGAFKAALTTDGVHPNAAGYAVMSPLAQEAVQIALAQGPVRSERGMGGMGRRGGGRGRRPLTRG